MIRKLIIAALLLPIVWFATTAMHFPRVFQVMFMIYILLGCALYYGVLTFNLAVTFWIDEPVIGITGLFMYLPITAFLLLKLAGLLPAPSV